MAHDTSSSNTNRRKIHPIQNIYKDNASIRRTMEEIENEMPYYQTGVRGDPDFKVQYRNHPFDKGENIERGRACAVFFVIVDEGGCFFGGGSAS